MLFNQNYTNYQNGNYNNFYQNNNLSNDYMNKNYNNQHSDNIKDLVIYSSATASTFITSYKTNYKYGRVAFKFIKHQTKPATIIDISFTFAEIFYFKHLICDDVKFLNELYKKLLLKQKNNNLDHMYVLKQSGISQERLFAKNKPRADGKAESLKVCLFFGDDTIKNQTTTNFHDNLKIMFFVSSGPGKVWGNGIIKPDGKPDKQIFIPITIRELKTHLLILCNDIENYLLIKKMKELKNMEVL